MTFIVGPPAALHHAPVAFAHDLACAEGGQSPILITPMLERFVEE